MATRSDSKQIPINPREHPAGTRLLLRNMHTGDPYEATALEWTAEGRVHIQLASGTDLWRDRPPFLVEVLPPPITAGKIFSGPDSDALWEAIGEPRSIPELRAALYKLACACQQLEDKYAR